MARKTYNVNLGIPYYSQRDSKWGSKPTSCKENGRNQTMDEVGCIITSVAMIFKSFGDDIDPGKLLEALKPNDCPFSWTTAESLYSHRYESRKSGTFDQLRAEIFKKIVIDKIPLLVRVPGHTVVATGFMGTLDVDIDGEPYYNQITPEMVRINDPYWSNHATLQDAINKKGAVEHFDHYTK